MLKTFGNWIDSFKDTNVLPVTAGACVAAVIAVLVWNAVTHPSTHSHPTRD